LKTERGGGKKKKKGGKRKKGTLAFTDPNKPVLISGLSKQKGKENKKKGGKKGRDHHNMTSSVHILDSIRRYLSQQTGEGGRRGGRGEKKGGCNRV